MAQNQALSKFLDNQQKLTEEVTYAFSSSSSLINNLKEKIKMVEQELATIVSTVKDMYVSFPPHKAERKQKKTTVSITSVHRRITEGSHLTFPDACFYAL